MNGNTINKNIVGVPSVRYTSRGFTANQRRADINNRHDITVRVKDFVKLMVVLGFCKAEISEDEIPADPGASFLGLDRVTGEIQDQQHDEMLDEIADATDSPIEAIDDGDGIGVIQVRTDNDDGLVLVKQLAHAASTWT